MDDRVQLELDAPGPDDERGDLPEEEVAEEMQAAMASFNCSH